MGVGKSTIGKRLARRLDFAYTDLDERIVTSENQTIKEIFAERGELAFREIERKTLEQISDSKIVISTGGGAPCYFDNMDKMLRSGIVIWLTMKPKMLINRLMTGKYSRPLLADLSENEMLNFIENQLDEREAFYQRAHIHVDVSSMNREKIDKLIGEIEHYSR